VVATTLERVVCSLVRLGNDDGCGYFEVGQPMS